MIGKKKNERKLKENETENEERMDFAPSLEKWVFFQRIIEKFSSLQLLVATGTRCKYDDIKRKKHLFKLQEYVY